MENKAQYTFDFELNPKENKDRNYYAKIEFINNNYMVSINNGKIKAFDNRLFQEQIIPLFKEAFEHSTLQNGKIPEKITLTLEKILETDFSEN